MKKNRWFGLALVATMMGASFSACSNEAEEVLAQESEIKLTSEITPSRVTSLDYQSEQIVKGQQVGVTIAGAKSEHKNVAWTVGTDGALTNTDDAVYYSGNNTATITAYHPYNSTWTGTSHTFSVSKDQSDEANYRNSDLLWATASSSKTEKAVGLIFAHKLAKVNVTLTSTDITDLSGATISICGTNIATNFNPSTGELSAAVADVEEIKAGVTTEEAFTASAIVVPQTVANGTKFIKVIHGSKTFYYTLTADKVLKSGYSHNYTLTVKEKELEVAIESDKITDWTDEDGNIGDANEEVFKMTAVDLGLSVKWAFCNLGAKTELERGDLYKWGEISPAQGNNTKENYAYYDVTTDTYQDLGDDISGTEYDAATVTLGEGWRMPTKSEWEELKSNCSATSYEIDGSSFYYVFQSNKNNNKIYIPATYSFYDYWTSTDYTYSSASLTDDNEFIAPYYFMLNFDYTEVKAQGIPYQGSYIRAVYDGE